MSRGKYKPMWMLVMFDLPTKSKVDKNNYVNFRNYLLRDGFDMIQFSVYACFCETKSKSEAKAKRISNYVPNHGEVRILNVTDTQYREMIILFNNRKVKPEKPKEQLLLF